MPQTNKVRTSIQSHASTRKAQPALEIVQSKRGRQQDTSHTAHMTRPPLSHEQAVQQAILRTG